MRRLGILAVALVLLACGSDGDSADPAVFCGRLDRLTENDPFLAFGDTATPTEIAQAFEALVARADELLEVAPDEVRPAARDYAEATQALDAELRVAGYAGAKVDARAYREAQQTYLDASDRLLRYLESEC